MKRLRLYADKDKEEIWLNKMCRMGWAMTGFFAGVYSFEPCEPGEYIYRIDMPFEVGKGNLRGEEKAQYIAFIEETGAEHVCNWFYWTIFRRKASKGEFELYTDPESQIALYQRIRRLFVCGGLIEVFCAIYETMLFLHLDTRDKAGIAILGMVYLVVLIFAVAIGKTSRKISKLREESLLTK